MKKKRSIKGKYHRILLKISGEMLQGEKKKYNIDPDVINQLAKEICEVHDLGVQLAMTVGGGNIFRGKTASALGMERTTADYMGMLATVINALSLQAAIEKIGIPTRVLTAIEMKQVAEPFIQRRAVRHLEKDRIVIFAAGTGNPYFSSDTGAALRAMEINAEAVLKATRVDGVYQSDPLKNKNAKMFRTLNFTDCLKKDLKVMDATAISLCRENNLPIHVFNICHKNNLLKVFMGEKIGTKVWKGKSNYV